MNVVAYLRVSSSEQADSGLGLAAQRQAIEAEAVRRGWTIVQTVEDAGLSGKNLSRPGLEEALQAVRSGQADAIVVSRLDRLSRSLVDFATLLADAKRRGYNVVALDLGVDLSTPAGEFLASVMASAAQWERRIISARTKAAMAIVKQNGSRSGRPVGNPSFRSVPEPIVALIRELRGEGLSYRKLADELNARQIPTAQGGKQWHTKTVFDIVKRATEQQAA